MSTMTEAAAPADVEGPTESAGGHAARTAGAVTGTPSGTAAGTAAPRTVPLRRNLNFQLLWAGSTCAFIGLAAADLAYPLVILAITHSPFQAGLFAMVQVISTMVLALPVGQLLDRRDRRHMLMLGEGVRAVAAAGVAAAYFLDVLTVWQLLGTAVILGGAQPFGTARMLIVRQVVPAEQLTTALTQEQVRNHASELAGPPLGGALYAVSRALPFVFAAATMVVSFLCACFVKVPAAEKSAARPQTADAAEPAEQPDNGVLSGLKVIVRNPLMRATALTIGLVNMVGYPLYLCLIVLLQHQHASSASIGLVLGAMAMGGLAGTALVKPLHRVFQPGRLLIAGCAGFAASVLGLSVVDGPFAAGALLCASGMPVPALVVMIDILILRQVPDEQRGRTNAALQFFLGLGMPVGLLIAGTALQYLSARTTLLGIGLALTAALAYAASQRALRTARWPDAASQDADEPAVRAA